MIPLSQYIRRGKAARDIPINVKPETETAVPVVKQKKKNWMAACLEYQLKHGFAPEYKAANDICSIGDIKRAVTTYFNLFDNDLESQRRDHRVMLPRQIVYYLAKKLTTKGTPTIGRSLGFRDHTTIISGIKKLERLMAINETIKPAIDLIEDHLRNGSALKIEEKPLGFRPLKSSPWTEDDEQMAIELSARGLSHPEIGQIIERTGAAVRARFRKLGVTGHAMRAAVRRERIKRATAQELKLMSNSTMSNNINSAE